jgi:hypothetical protein
MPIMLHCGCGIWQGARSATVCVCVCVMSVVCVVGVCDGPVQKDGSTTSTNYKDKNCS